MKKKHSTGFALRAFTLLEMLIVIGIIATLLAVSIPAVNSISKSNSRKSALSNLLGTIDQAHSLAVKDGQATYVVFPDRLPNQNDAAMVSQYSYRSYAIFEDDSNNPGAIKQITAWKSLPTGACIRTGSINYLANSTAFPFTPQGSSATGKFPFLKFSATGEVDPSTTRTPNTTGTIQFGVFEGYVDANGNEKMTTKTNFTDSIEVSRLTGHAQRM